MTSLRTRNRLVLSGAALLVFASHFTMQFLLYRARVFGVFTLADSDVVVFLVPFLLALSAYGVILYRVVASKTWSALGKVTFVVLVTIVVGFLSFWASMLVPINVYGT